MAVRPAVSGHIYLVERKRGEAWYVKWRDVDGQHQRRLGPAWSGTGRAPEGHLRRRDAQAELEAILTEARRQWPAGPRSTVSVAEAAREWLRHGEVERGWKPSTRKDYRSAVERHLIPELGERELASLTTSRIESWRTRWLAEHGQIRMAAKLVAVLHSIFVRADGCTASP